MEAILDERCRKSNRTFNFPKISPEQWFKECEIINKQCRDDFRNERLKYIINNLT